jgi:iron complex outermembrane receptor protein
MNTIPIIWIFMLSLLTPEVSFSANDSSSINEAVRKHLTLEEIIVVAQIEPDLSYMELGIKQIENGRNITIPDVLKFEPDIDLKRRALVGDTTDSLAIRGLSGNRIMLNINGRPVNAAGVVGGYYIDWGTIPLDNIEKIELIKGGSSARYGNNALGGVVNVITKKPTEDPTLDLFGNYGSGDGIDTIENYRVTHTYKVGPLGYSLAGSYQKADAFLWNNDFEAKNMALSIYLDMPLDGLATIGFQYADSQRGFIRQNRLSDNPSNPDFYNKLNGDYPLAFGETFSPYSGSAFIPGPGANWKKTKYYFDFGYTQPIFDAVLDLKLSKNVEDRKEKNYSSSLINNTYQDGQLVLDREVGSDRSYHGSLELSRQSDNHELLVGIERKKLAYGDIKTNYADMTYNNAPWVTEDRLSSKPSSEGIANAYYIQDSWRISGQWLLTGGIRYDDYENRPINNSTLPRLNDSALSPKLTGTYHINDTNKMTVSVYQALRTPGLPETYWWAQGATGGNPELKSEKNDAVELLYQHDFSKTDYVRISMHNYDVNDYIVFRIDPTWRGVYNIDNVEIYGASLDGKKTFNDWLSGSAALTWQKSKKSGDIYDTAGLSNEIDYLPEWKASADLEFKLPYQSSINVNARYVDERHAIYAYRSGQPPQQYFSLVELGSYVTADINLKFPLGQYTELSCYAENIFDEEYEERFGYPMPGLTIGMSIKLSL